MGDLDWAILELRRTVPPKQPWQRKLLGALADADRQMQVMRITGVIGKSDAEIVVAGQQLGATCRHISHFILGGRADGTVRGLATLIARIGAELLRALEAFRVA